MKFKFCKCKYRLDIAYYDKNHSSCAKNQKEETIIKCNKVIVKVSLFNSIKAFFVGFNDSMIISERYI